MIELARSRQKNLFLSGENERNQLSYLATRTNAFYFANSGPKMIRQPFEINNYPVFQTSVIILEHVKRQISKHVNSTATDRINVKRPIL